MAVLLLALNLLSNLRTLLAQWPAGEVPAAPGSFDPASMAAAPDSTVVGAFTMTPLLPGVNLPLSHAAYLLPAVFVSLAVHEAGHALAAGAEGIRVLAAGVFLAGPSSALLPAPKP